jgi:Tfp pilus assembly protein PilF
MGIHPSTGWTGKGQPAKDLGVDINALFARAERACAAGSFAAARADLAQVLRLAGPQPAVLHLTALNEARAGEVAAARTAFAAAIRAAPNDAQVLNNFANFLKQQGDTEAALTHYGAALRAAPGLHQARLNRAILLNSLGRLAEARRDADSLLSVRRDDPAVRQTSGAIHLAMGNLEAAAADFDAVLAAKPQDLKGLHGRARVAAIAGYDELAISLYRAARRQAPDDAELALGLAEALEHVERANAGAPTPIATTIGSSACTGASRRRTQRIALGRLTVKGRTASAQACTLLARSAAATTCSIMPMSALNWAFFVAMPLFSRSRASACSRPSV